MCVPRDPVRTIRTGLFRPVSRARRQPEQAADLFPAEGATRGVVGVSFGKRLQYVRLGEPTLRLFIHRRRIILIGFAGHANERNPGSRNRRFLTKLYDGQDHIAGLRRIRPPGTALRCRFSHSSAAFRMNRLPRRWVNRSSWTNSDADERATRFAAHNFAAHSVSGPWLNMSASS
jgi:hypothetical protein